MYKYLSGSISDEMAERLSSMGYRAGFMDELEGGEEIVLLTYGFEEGTTQIELFDILEVIPGSVRHDKRFLRDGAYDTLELDSWTVRFVVRMANGATKPVSFDSAGILYLRIPEVPIAPLPWWKRAWNSIVTFIMGPPSEDLDENH